MIFIVLSDMEYTLYHIVCYTGYPQSQESIQWEYVEQICWSEYVTGKRKKMKQRLRKYIKHDGEHVKHML